MELFTMLHDKGCTGYWFGRIIDIWLKKLFYYKKIKYFLSQFFLLLFLPNLLLFLEIFLNFLDLNNIVAIAHNIQPDMGYKKKARYVAGWISGTTLYMTNVLYMGPKILSIIGQKNVYPDF